MLIERFNTEEKAGTIQLNNTPNDSFIMDSGMVDGK